MRAAADEILTVSPTWAEDLKEISGKDAKWITNGYDEADFEGFQNRADQSKIRLVHTGIITSMRNPDALWSALDNWLENNPDKQHEFELRFAGTVDAAVRAAIQKQPELQSRVQYLGYLSHEEIIEEYEKANGFLLLLNQSENAKGHIPGKFFEYAASGKPIFGIGHPDSDVGHLIEREHKGVLVSENDNDLRNKLNGFLASLTKQPNHTTAEGYSRRFLTEKLCKLLESV